MTDLAEKLLASTPLHVALVAIVLLVLGTGPVGRKLTGLLERKAPTSSWQRLSGVGIVNRLEEDKAPFPRPWEKWVDERIEHKARGLLQTLNSHMELTEEKLGKVEAMDDRLHDLQASLARIEGMLDRRTRPR
jgi:hypothetical protein